jgi:hypothetical protein
MTSNFTRRYSIFNSDIESILTDVLLAGDCLRWTIIDIVYFFWNFPILVSSDVEIQIILLQKRTAPMTLRPKLVTLGSFQKWITI